MLYFYIFLIYMEDRFIANPEGFNIDELVKLNGSDTANGRIIICGNIMDSTSNNGCDFLEKKCFNIRNIQKCVSDNNYSLIFGPRDINKIKIVQLCKLQLNQSQQSQEKQLEIQSVGRYI